MEKEKLSHRLHRHWAWNYTAVSPEAHRGTWNGRSKKGCRTISSVGTQLWQHLPAGRLQCSGTKESPFMPFKPPSSCWTIMATMQTYAAVRVRFSELITPENFIRKMKWTRATRGEGSQAVGQSWSYWCRKGNHFSLWPSYKSLTQLDGEFTVPRGPRGLCCRSTEHLSLGQLQAISEVHKAVTLKECVAVWEKLWNEEPSKPLLLAGCEMPFGSY